MGFLDTYEHSCNVGNAVTTKAVHSSSSSVSCPIPSVMTTFGSRKNYLNALDEGLAKSQFPTMDNLLLSGLQLNSMRSYPLMKSGSLQEQE